MKIIYSKSFKKDFKKLDELRQKKVLDILEKLSNGETLDEKYYDHALKGKLKDFRDCHIEPNLILLYQITADRLILNALRIGSHSAILG